MARTRDGGWLGGRASAEKRMLAKDRPIDPEFSSRFDLVMAGINAVGLKRWKEWMANNPPAQVGGSTETFAHMVTGLIGQESGQE